MIALGEIIRKLRPYLSDFADSISRKERQPKSDMARDNFRFLTIPYVFKSSKTIVCFSRIILVDSLCKKSVRVSLDRVFGSKLRWRCIIEV